MGRRWFQAHHLSVLESTKCRLNVILPKLSCVNQVSQDDFRETQRLLSEAEAHGARSGKLLIHVGQNSKEVKGKRP